VNKFILTKYNEFLDQFPQRFEPLAGLAYTPLRYFYLADVQIQGFIINLELQFKHLKVAEQKNYSEQCYAYCYGFYALIRTCLEVSSKLSDAIQLKACSEDLKVYRDSMHKKIKKIIDIANDCVKHPAGNIDKVTWYEPGGLSSHGEFSIYEWSTTNSKHFKVITVNPILDITTVFKHLEKLAELYIQQLSKLNNTGI
jgi:hypothetical protein